MAGFMIEDLESGKVRQFHWDEVDDLPRDGSAALLDVRTEWELSLIHIYTKSKAQAEGIAAAHLKGVKLGRPRCTVEGWDTYYPQWKQGQITAVQCYKQLGICLLYTSRVGSAPPLQKGGDASDASPPFHVCHT